MWNFGIHRIEDAPRDGPEYYSTRRLRSTGFFFLVGKIVSAPLNILILYILASRLSESIFAVYVWLLAFGEFLLSFSYFGLNWIAVNYIPQLRARSGGSPLRRLIVVLGSLRVGSVAVLLAICWLGAPPVAAGLGQARWLPAFDLFLVVLLVEAAVRFGQDCVLGPLWKQRAALVQVLVRHLAFLTGLLVALHALDDLSIEAVIAALLSATLLALVLASVHFVLVLRELAERTGEGGAPLPGWPALARFAGNNYAQDVIRHSAGGPLLTMLVAPLIGPAALATFGFARSLAQHVARMLPSQLFMGLLRPKLIAGYTADGSFGSLNRQVVLVLKISNCVFGASLAAMVAYGEPILGYLSGGRYGVAHGVLLLLMLRLAVVNTQSLLAVVVNAIGRSEFLRRAAPALLVVLPLAAALAWLGMGAYGLAVAMLGGEALFVFLILRQLRRVGHDFAFDRAGHARIGGAFLAACLTGLLLAGVLPARPDADLVGVAGTLLAFLAALRALRPFDQSERQAIARLLGRRLGWL